MPASVDKSTAELDQPAAHAGDDPGSESDALGVGQARSFCEELGRQHDQKHVREQRDRVDAVGKGAHVRSPVALSDAVRQKGVVEVPDDERKRCTGQDRPVHQLRRKSEHEATQAVDEQQLNEVVEREPEEPVEVTAHEGAHRGRIPQAAGPVGGRERVPL